MNNLKLHCITSCSLLPFTIHLPSHWTVLLLFSLCCFVVFIVIDILCFVKCFLFIFLFNFELSDFMNELARRFCVDFFNIKKVAISLDSLFFCQHILFRREPFAVKTPSKKID